MKRGRLLKPVLWLTAACIILPAIVLLIWCFAARWPWPGILPESLSLRTVKELIFGSAKLPKLLLSSISLSFAVAAISTTIGIATARATELYEFRGKGLIRFFSLLPLLVPGTVLAIGTQIMLLKVGLGDSIAGIILIHTVASVPYCITIMTDVTAALGDKFEEQAATLGAGPFRAFFEVTLPLGIRFYGKYDSYFGQHWLRLTILFGISGIFALILLQELRKMFKTVLNGDCFIRENVQSLKRMGICSFCIAAVTALRLFLYLTPAVLITILVFVIAGLFSLVLSRVFDAAVTYKLENDLTI